MLARLALVSLVLLTVSPAAAVQPGSAVVLDSAGALCFGQAPTIVGTPGEVIVGTEGPDVVVTNGSWGAATLGGDDLLCLTGVAQEPDQADNQPIFDTGVGNDRIDATSGEYPYFVALVLGPGADEVVGGPHTSDGFEVFATDESPSDPDADAIHTGGGSDRVFAGGQDVVDMGAGADYLSLSVVDDSWGGAFDGGRGWDAITLEVARSHGHSTWKLDTPAHQLTREGDLVAAVSSFSTFQVKVPGPLRFIGSAASERFESSQTNWPVSVSMRGGHDVVRTHLPGRTSRYDGGGGRDRFVFRGPLSTKVHLERAFFDLSTGALHYRLLDNTETKMKAVDFEDVEWAVTSGVVTIKGTDEANSILTRFGWGRAERAILDGEGGNDTLRGGWGYDVLIGGPGHDSADGGAGIDHCEAEVLTHCES